MPLTTSERDNFTALVDYFLLKKEHLQWSITISRLQNDLKSLKDELTFFSKNDDNHESALQAELQSAESCQQKLLQKIQSLELTLSDELKTIKQPENHRLQYFSFL